MLLSPLGLRALSSTLCARFSTTAQAGKKAFSPETQERTQLPYFVHRSHQKNFPVYTETKGGGTLRQTRIRKVEGDANALREDLITHLDLNPAWVTVNGTTNHVIVKGWRKDNIERVLAGLNF